MSAPLENLLRMLVSGYGAMPMDVYQASGGEGALDEIRKFDPNAHWADELLTEDGNEAGTPGKAGKRLVVDISKLPTSKRGTAGFDLSPADHFESVKRGAPNAERNEFYGAVRNSNEFAGQKGTLLEILGPLFVSMVAPMAGAGLAGAGIGLGAGGTSAATGAAAGLGAGNIAAGGTASFAGTAARQLPSLLRSYSQNGGISWQQLASMLAAPGAEAAGINPNYLKAAMTMAQLARGR